MKNTLDNFNFTIGICAKNEENLIFDCLGSVEESLESFVKKPEIIICINQTTDNTKNEVKKFAKRSKIKIKIIFAKNLIESQRKIWNSAKNKPVVFIDADVKIAKNAIFELLRPMQKNAKIMISYAESKYVWPKNPTLVSRIYKLYTSEKLLYSRRYFHGRMFAIRDWNIPPQNEILARAEKGKSLLKYGRGIMTDDIILSFYIIKKYGEDSIFQVKNPQVFSRPIEGFSEWREMYRRANIELVKIMKWFPEYRKFGKMPRKTNWRKFAKVNFCEKFYWSLYILLKFIWRISLGIELTFTRCGFIKAKEQWKVSNSTKRKF